MYRIKRYNSINDLEMLLMEGSDRALAERVANEFYRFAIEIIIEALNDHHEDPYSQKTVLLIDRVDKQFRQSNIHPHLRQRCFEYVVGEAEQIRTFFLQLGCPGYVKYRVDFSQHNYQNATDIIRIDFEATALYMLKMHLLDPSTEIRQSERVELNPSLETLNAYYETVNK